MNTSPISSTVNIDPLEAAKPAPSKARLLLVEDNEDIAQVLSIGLRIAGYEVVSVWTSHEAIKHLRSHPVDLVITDWMLPDGTGGDVCEAARNVNFSIPVVVISAVIDQWNADLLKCGSNAYLKKPIDMTTLRHVIERLL